MKRERFPCFFVIFLLCLIAALFTVPPRYAAARDSGGESDFIIKKGVLTGYTGTDEDIVIPDGVTEIGARAFVENRSIKSVVIPESVKKIGEHAFEYCANLKSVTFHDGLEEIGTYAFRHCTSLSGISLPDSLRILEEEVFGSCKALTEIEIPRGVTVLSRRLFANCSNLETVILPDTLTAMKSYVFVRCKSLTELVIPEGVKTINNRVFLECENLKSISFPKSLAGIGFWAFKGTQWLSDRIEENPIVIVNHILVDGTAAEGKVVVPETVTKIMGDAFYLNDKLTEVVLPEGLKTIKHSAFSHCYNLERINLPNSLTKIEYSAFTGCGLREIDLPDGLTIISDRTFQSCRNLSRVGIPDSVLTIEEYAFDFCWNLEQIQIPASVREIAPSAFNSFYLKWIYGSAGSKAESYAEEKDILFSTEPMPKIPVLPIVGDSYVERALEYSIAFDSDSCRDGIRHFFTDDDGSLCAFLWVELLLNDEYSEGVQTSVLKWTEDRFFTTEELPLPAEFADKVYGGSQIKLAEYDEEGNLCLLYEEDRNTGRFIKISPDYEIIYRLELGSLLTDEWTKLLGTKEVIWETVWIEEDKSADCYDVLSFAELPNDTGASERTYCLFRISKKAPLVVRSVLLPFEARQISEGKIFGIGAASENESIFEKKLYVSDRDGTILIAADIPLAWETGKETDPLYAYRNRFDMNVMDGTAYVISDLGFYRLNENGTFELLMGSENSRYLNREKYEIAGLVLVSESEFYVLYYYYSRTIPNFLVQYRLK